jgi:hypothetical protein
MIVDLSANHELNFYREADQISIAGRVNGVSYASTCRRVLRLPTS